MDLVSVSNCALCGRIAPDNRSAYNRTSRQTNELGYPVNQYPLRSKSNEVLGAQLGQQLPRKFHSNQCYGNQLGGARPVDQAAQGFPCLQSTANTLYLPSPLLLDLSGHYEIC